MIASERAVANIEKKLLDKDAELKLREDALKAMEAEVAKAHDDLHTAIDKATKAEAESQAALGRPEGGSGRSHWVRQ